MTTNKQLSILIGMDSFVYMVISQNRIVLIKNYSIKPYNAKYPQLYLDDLQDVILTDVDLRPAFQKVFLGWSHPLAVIVPDGLYDENQRHVFLEHLTGQSDSLAIFTSEIPSIKAKVVHSLDFQIVKALDHLLPTAHITHVWSSLINYLLEYHCGNQQGRHLFVNFHLSSIEIFAFDEKWLLYANSFNFEQAEDVLYSILLVMQELKMDTQSTNVFLAGQLIEDSAIYRLLFRYLSRMSFYDHEDLYAFGAKMQEMPLHYFIDIMSVSRMNSLHN